MKKITELTKRANRLLSLWGVDGRIVVGEERAPIPIYWESSGLGTPSLTFKFDRREIAAYFDGDKQVIVTDWVYYTGLDSSKVMRKLFDANWCCFVTNSQVDIHFSLPFLLALRAYTIYLESLGTSHVFSSLNPYLITMYWFVGDKFRTLFDLEIRRHPTRTRLLANHQEVMSGKTADILRTAIKMTACLIL